MRTGGRARHLARDLAAAFVAFFLVFGVGYLFGRWTFPEFDAVPEAASEFDAAGESPVDGTASSEEAVESTAEVSIESLRDALADMDPPAALLAASGVVEGRLVFDGGESLSSGFLPVEFGEGEELAVDVNVRFTGGGTTLTIVTDALAVGEERSEGISVVLSTDGMMFFSQAGMCTIELQDLGFTAEASNMGIGQITKPFFEGHLTCVDVPELRSGELVTLKAVFELRNASANP